MALELSEFDSRSDLNLFRSLRWKDPGFVILETEVKSFSSKLVGFTWAGNLVSTLADPIYVLQVSGFGGVEMPANELMDSFLPMLAMFRRCHSDGALLSFSGELSPD